jgi:hypothetical protein
VLEVERVDFVNIATRDADAVILHRRYKAYE